MIPAIISTVGLLLAIVGAFGFSGASTYREETGWLWFLGLGALLCLGGVWLPWEG